MLTVLGKTLGLLVLVLSIAFMATTLALSFTSPPFEQRADELTDYAIITNPQTETTPLSYTGKRLIDDEQIAQSEKLPDVVVAVYKDKAAQANQKLETLNQQIAFYDARLGTLEQTIEPDKAAMQRQVESLRQRVRDVRAERAEIAATVGRRQEDVEGLLRVAEARRADVFRLKANLLQARADTHRNQQLVRQLEDLIAQIDGDLVKARNREEQLQAQLGGAGESNIDSQTEQLPEALKQNVFDLVAP